MRSCRNSSPFAPEGFANNRRRAGRVRCTLLQSDMGTVADLSATGMRLDAKRRPRINENDRGKVELSWDDRTLTVCCRVVRVRKCGFLRWDVGLEFENVTPEQLVAINEAARFGGSVESMSGIGCNRNVA